MAGQRLVLLAPPKSSSRSYYTDLLGHSLSTKRTPCLLHTVQGFSLPLKACLVSRKLHKNPHGGGGHVPAVLRGGKRAEHQVLQVAADLQRMKLWRGRCWPRVWPLGLHVGGRPVGVASSAGGTCAFSARDPLTH